MNLISEMKPGDKIRFPQPKIFEFVKELKSGGTGKTILMLDATLNEQFVCKKYDPVQKEYEDDFYKRFVDEIKIMYSVFNNNIVRIYDYYLYPKHKTGYIIMEYISGKNIDEYFQFEDSGRINSVFVQIINAFAYLEKKGILHRDVRAGNVIIDDTDTVKIIDFGFGKRLNMEPFNEYASVVLDWPASKIPEEIWKEVYNEKTEIFYVGYLIKNVIEKYNIKCFKYSVLLDKMIAVNPEERIESFELIQKSIAEQTFENVEFTDKQKEIYQRFAADICKVLHQIKDTLILESDISTIIEKLRGILRDNSLEKYVSHPNNLISVFVRSKYTYYEKEILVEDVKQFYEFFVSQSDVLRGIILNNLYGRLGNVPVIDSIFGNELPFD